MPLSAFGRHWKRPRRLLGWSIFLLAIAAVGIGLYLIAPPEPRRVLADGPRGVFYAGEGRIATYRLADGKASGPVRLWDAGTAAESGSFLSGDKSFRAHGHSGDGRYFVALVNGDRPDTTRICGVDPASALRRAAAR